MTLVMQASEFIATDCLGFTTPESNLLRFLLDLAPADKLHPRGRSD